MDRFARVILGYHGCEVEFANSLLSGETSIQDWEPSQNSYDWLGHGIYFWEHAPQRAREWSRARKNKGVIGAVIQLGLCLDLTEVRFTQRLSLEYGRLVGLDLGYARSLPANRGKLRDLDCFVINTLVKTSAKVSDPFQSVRCPFLEGEPAFPGSDILRESHIQISVIDRECILGVFRPNFSD